MSFVQPDTLVLLADSVGVPKFATDAAKVLAPDVEYRLREIVQAIQGSLRCCKQSERTKARAKPRAAVCAADVRAMRSPLLASHSQDAVKFQRHSKRVALSTDDITQALRMRNVQVRQNPSKETSGFR